MKILVIDVAAEYGGALTVLNQFIKEFENDTENEYIVVLSKLVYENKKNIKFIKCEWVKKNHIYRLFFDAFFVKKLVKKYKPQKVISLQNKAFNCRGVAQEVFFHNALPISSKRFGFFESRSLWVYQNIIGNIVKGSLKRADKIVVQADWIKKELRDKWKIPEKKIFVKQPIYDPFFQSDSFVKYQSDEVMLFYPANSAIYKNHESLIKAFDLVLNEKCFSGSLKLVLTLPKSCLSPRCVELINNRKLPIVFLNRLTKEEMREWYSKSILVFPSYLETIGLPLAEAKGMGCKILAADCGYAHDTLGKYERASFFDPFSTKSIKDAIIEALHTIDQ